jgi:hypothetical protein
MHPNKYAYPIPREPAVLVHSLIILTVISLQVWRDQQNQIICVETKSICGIESLNCRNGRIIIVGTVVYQCFNLAQFSCPLCNIDSFQN